MSDSTNYWSDENRDIDGLTPELDQDGEVDAVGEDGAAANGLDADDRSIDLDLDPEGIEFDDDDLY